MLQHAAEHAAVFGKKCRSPRKACAFLTVQMGLVWRVVAVTGGKPTASSPRNLLNRPREEEPLGSRWFRSGYVVVVLNHLCLGKWISGASLEFPVHDASSGAC